MNQPPEYPCPEQLEASFSNTLLNQDQGIWIWEPLTEALYFNKIYMEMLGYSTHSFPRHISTWAKLIHPDQSETVTQSQMRFILSPEHGDQFSNRFQLRTASGDYKWILGKGSVLTRDEKGHAVRVVGSHLDLVALDATLQYHLLQSDRLRFAMEAAKDGLWDWNTETNEVYYSPRYISMMGFNPEDFPPTIDSWISHVYPDDLDSTVYKQFQHISSPALGNEFECTYRFRAADGTYKWMLGRGAVTRRNAQGRATRIVGLHTDITELRNTQENLANMVNRDTLTQVCSRFYFDSAIQRLNSEQLPISLVYCDIDGLKLINDYLGHAQGDLLLKKAAQILQQHVRTNDIVARLGGDEFAILLIGCLEINARKVLSQIHSACEQHNQNPNQVPLFLSLGLVSTEANTPIHKLVTRADEDMLINKHRTHAQHHQKLRTWLETQNQKLG